MCERMPSVRFLCGVGVIGQGVSGGLADGEYLQRQAEVSQLQQGQRALPRLGTQGVVQRFAILRLPRETVTAARAGIRAD